MKMTSVLFKSKLFAGCRPDSPRGLVVKPQCPNKGPRFESRRHALFFLVFFLLFLLSLFFYHSYHKNNCLRHKDQSFFNNRGQNIVTAYDSDINKTRHKEKNEPRLKMKLEMLTCTRVMLQIKGFFSPIDQVKGNQLSARFPCP